MPRYVPKQRPNLYRRAATVRQVKHTLRVGDLVKIVGDADHDLGWVVELCDDGSYDVEYPLSHSGNYTRRELRLICHEGEGD